MNYLSQPTVGAMWENDNLPIAERIDRGAKAVTTSLNDLQRLLMYGTVGAMTGSLWKGSSPILLGAVAGMAISVIESFIVSNIKS